MIKPRIIAYYLPQYHTIPENDKWWGKDFTEWTTVKRAVPLFKGHYQPKIPADLGYYNLRQSNVREEQARLAHNAGIEGFCYWHYWFGNGKELLETPFKEVLESGHPDFPFCLAWANESWQRKEWGNTYGKKNTTLIEQQYAGTEDNRQHFESLKKAFADKRYITMDNKPVFIIYKPFKFKEIRNFIKEWNQLIFESGIAEKFYFIAQIDNDKEVAAIKNFGFDAATVNIVHRFVQPAYKYGTFFSSLCNFIIKIPQNIKRRIYDYPFVLNYSKAIQYITHKEFDIREDIIPTIIPNWDHSPRSGKHNTILRNSSPSLFKVHLNKVFSLVNKKKNNLVMLKSWNEWGEGNYMEPDIKYGHGYLDVLKECIEKVEQQ